MEKFIHDMNRQMDGLVKCARTCLEDNNDMICEKCRLWHDDTGCEAFGLDYTEMRKLHALMTEAGIQHTFFVHLGGYVLKYPDYENQVCSAILHGHSYGAFDGLIEISGLLTPEEEEVNSVCGYLTGDDVFNRIKKHWEEQKK